MKTGEEWSVPFTKSLMIILMPVDRQSSKKEAENRQQEKKFHEMKGKKTLIQSRPMMTIFLCVSPSLRASAAVNDFGIDKNQ